MPKRSRKRQYKEQEVAAVVSDNEKDTNENDDITDDDDSISEEEIDVEFDGSSPNENDFHGILNLLHQLFVTLRVSSSPLVDKIIEQSHIGSTLKITNNDDDEIYGLTTAVTMDNELPFFEELTNAIYAKINAKDQSKAEMFKKQLTNKKSMLMINERFINVPIQLAVPLLTSLSSDVNSELIAKKNSKETKKALFHGVEQILVICKTLKKVENLDEVLNGSIQTEHKTKKKKKKRKTDKNDDNDEQLTPQLEFVNAEEELFLKVSSFHSSYSVVEATGLASGQTWDHDDQPMKTYRTVLLLPIKSLKSLVKDVEEFIGTET